MNWILDMDTKNENGYTKREELMQVINSTPQDSKAHISAYDQLINEPEIPYCVSHVYDWFWDLHRGRASGFNGPEPISYLDIYSWSVLKSIELRDIEIDILKIMDSIYLNFVYSKKAKKKK
jgi:hypothetical protein